MKTFARGLAITLGLLVVVAAGAWLLLQRPDIPYATLEAKYGYPDSQYLDLPGGVRAHYRDLGPRDAPAIVLVHGYSASTHAWDAWAARLSKSYRVVVLDLPGHGLTRTSGPYLAGRQGFVAVVDALTARLGLTRFTLAGNSMGGAVAWTYAVDHPDKVQRLVLVDAAGWPSEKSGGALIFTILRHPIGRAVLKDVDTRTLVAQAALWVLGPEAGHAGPDRSVCRALPRTWSSRCPALAAERTPSRRHRRRTLDDPRPDADHVWSGGPDHPRRRW